MKVKNLIKDSIPPLKHTDTVERALSWLDEFQLQHLPVVKGVSFLGLITEVDLLGLKDQSEILGNYNLSLPRPFLEEDQHVYDAVKFIVNHEYSIIPVLDSDEKYVGFVTLTDLIESLAEFKSVNSPGGIITLEFSRKDYSLAEVARIIENNDAIILSSSVRPSEDASCVILTMKLNVIDLSRIISAFERRNMKIISSFHSSEFGFDLKDRYDQLMKYLDI